MQLPDEYQNDLQGRDGRCYYHEVLLFQGKEEWKKEWKKNKNLRLQTNIVPEPKSPSKKRKGPVTATRIQALHCSNVSVLDLQPLILWDRP